MGRAVYQALCELDCREVLPAIRVPTLIVHRIGERVARIEAARYMAERIPGAGLVELPGIDHSFTMGEWEPVVDEIEQFLTPPERQVDRVLATVLFTDIVGSTARAVDPGDLRWRELLAAHNALIRQALQRFGGRQVNTTGDGFLATFAGPSRAIECARALHEGVRQLGLQIRIGLHTGERELMGEDVGGLAVHIGARVAARAEPCEVLVSSTVKDLVAGSGIELDDRGTHVLKGIPGTGQLFAVSS